MIMAQVPPEWEEVTEFNTMVREVVEKYPDRFAHVDPDWLIAYICTNKTKPESKAKLYDMSGQTEPEAFTNSKKYFIKMFHDTWEALPEENRYLIVFSALRRIDKEKPESGKVGGYDLHDDSLMARTFGVDWALRGGVPHILKDDVDFKEEPVVS
jgi:hypothetical protein